NSRSLVCGPGPWNNWNFGTLETAVGLIRLERSAAVEPFDRTAMWMSSPLHTRPLFSFFLHDFSTSRPKRDLLLCVARHTAVTLTRNAPLFRAQGPGISVSRVEPSGVFFSRFCQSSSRSLGRCLLLGQRSRMNLFSHLIGSLFHQ